MHPFEVHVREDSLGEVLEVLLLHLLDYLGVGSVGGVHVVHGVEVHDPRRQRLDLLDQVLDPLFVPQPALVGLHGLAVRDLDEKHQDVLELLRHDGLDVQHVLDVDFVALDLVEPVDVHFVAFEGEELLELFFVHHVGLGVEHLLHFEPLLFGGLCDFLLDLLFHGGSHVVDELLVLILHREEPVNFRTEPFKVLPDAVTLLSDLRFEGQFADLIGEHFVVPPDDFVLRIEIVPECRVVTGEILDAINDVSPKLVEIFVSRQLQNEVLGVFHFRAVTLRMQNLLVFIDPLLQLFVQFLHLLDQSLVLIELLLEALPISVGVSGECCLLVVSLHDGLDLVEGLPDLVGFGFRGEYLLDVIQLYFEVVTSFLGPFEREIVGRQFLSQFSETLNRGLVIDFFLQFEYVVLLRTVVQSYLHELNVGDHFSFGRVELLDGYFLARELTTDIPSDLVEVFGDQERRTLVLKFRLAEKLESDVPHLFAEAFSNDMPGDTIKHFVRRLDLRRRNSETLQTCEQGHALL